MPKTVQPIPKRRLRAKLRRLILGLAIVASALFAVAGVGSYAYPMEGHFRPHARVLIGASFCDGIARIKCFHEWKNLAPYQGWDTEAMLGDRLKTWRQFDAGRWLHLSVSTTPPFLRRFFDAQGQHAGHTWINLGLSAFVPISVLALFPVASGLWRRASPYVRPIWKEIWRPEPPVWSFSRRLRRFGIGVLSSAFVFLIFLLTVGRVLSLDLYDKPVPVKQLIVGRGYVSTRINFGSFGYGVLSGDMNRRRATFFFTARRPDTANASSEARWIAGLSWWSGSDPVAGAPSVNADGSPSGAHREYLSSTTRVSRTLVIPMWAVWPLLLGPVLLAFIRGPMRRCRRRTRGLCVVCGYNLTGLPEPRCPECGHRASDLRGSTNAASEGG